MEVGEVFGKLTVVQKATAYKSPKGRVRRRWLCSCSCGGMTIAKEDHLKDGHTTSCGCKGKEALARSNAERKKYDYKRRPNLIAFKRLVRKRDRGRCFVCDTKKNIEVHHLYNFMSHNELAGDVRNGLCLCKDCHKAFHLSLGGFGVPCTAGDFLNWAVGMVPESKIERRWGVYGLVK